MAPGIPKRLIQTGKSRDLPLLARAVVANIKLLNPDFEYLFFDDAQVEDFIDQKFPQHRATFDSFPVRIQKYDFFRYLAVYHFGGFYLDLDVILASGLHDLLECSCVFPFEELSIHSYLNEEYGMDWEIGNYAFGAAAGHPLLRAVIDNCVRAQQEPAWAEPMWRDIPRPFRREFYVLDTTGPGLVSRTLAEFPEAANQVTVLFPADVCDPRSWHCFGEYGVHLQEGGWRTRKNFVFQKLAALWESRRRAAFLGRSKHRGPARSLHVTKRPAP